MTTLEQILLILIGAMLALILMLFRTVTTLENSCRTLLELWLKEKQIRRDGG